MSKVNKYIIDLDAFVACLDCVDSIKNNGRYYIDVELLKEFICRFPKEPVNLKPFELDNSEPEEPADNSIGF